MFYPGGLGQESGGIFTTQEQRDAATAKAQHDAALAAIAARNAGDGAAYSAAINQLYALGIQNATEATNADLQAIADNANRASIFGDLSNIGKYAAIGLGVLLLYPFIVSAVASRRR